jgi:hypothetical protein
LGIDANPVEIAVVGKVTAPDGGLTVIGNFIEALGF